MSKDGYIIDEKRHSVNKHTQRLMDFYDAKGYFPDFIITDRIRLSRKPKYYEMKRCEDYIIFDPSDKTSNATIKSTIKFIVPSEDSKSYYAYIEIYVYDTFKSTKYLSGYVSLNSSAIDIIF